MRRWAVVLVAVLAAVLVVPAGPASGSAVARASVDDPVARDAVTRFYLGILGRAPDPGGLQGWTAAYTGVGSIPTIAGAFVGSPEYQARYGTPDDATFVTLLYRNALRRDPDPGGLNDWAGALGIGASRALVAAAITQSPEAVQVSGTAPAPGPLPAVPTALGGAVRHAMTRLYLGILGRVPDAPGLQAWTGAYRTPDSLTTIAGAFVASAEYQARYGTPDDATFVTLLYRNALGREPDPEGFAGWTAALGGGTSRTAVANAFAQSAEAVQVTGTRPPPTESIGPASPGPSAPSRRTVALTFDDGPSAYTGQVLDVLGRYGVRATFFAIGMQVGGRSAVVARAAAAGHSVQNHTWSHPSLTTLSNSSIAGQLTSTSNAIAGATGIRPSCYRPPGGSTNDRVRGVASSVGLREVMWTVETSDYLRPSPSTIASRVLSKADGRSMIVLMHDGGGNRSNTVAALPAMIEGLRARGYTFVTLCR